MLYAETLQIVKDLPFDNDYVFHKSNGVEIFLRRPSILPPRFKDYDLKKNFQIFIRDGERVFRPNHLRVMIDLNLRVRSRPDLRNNLLSCFDGIFYQGDPDVLIEPISNENFEHFLNPLSVIAHLSQLFIVEQDYNYLRESKFEPPTLFYQGWIRQFLVSNKEIDNLCMSVCNGQPPMVEFTQQDNKKHKKYEENRDALWYLRNNA